MAEIKNKGVSCDMHLTNSFGKIYDTDKEHAVLKFNINHIRVWGDTDTHKVNIEINDDDERDRYYGSYSNIEFSSFDEVELLIFRLQQELKRMRELDK